MKLTPEQADVLGKAVMELLVGEVDSIEIKQSIEVHMVDIIAKSGERRVSHPVSYDMPIVHLKTGVDRAVSDIKSRLATG